MADSDYVACDAQSGGYTCTRRKGHGHIHVSPEQITAPRIHGRAWIPFPRTVDEAQDLSKYNGQWTGYLLLIDDLFDSFYLVAPKSQITGVGPSFQSALAKRFKPEAAMADQPFQPFESPAAERDGLSEAEMSEFRIEGDSNGIAMLIHELCDRGPMISPNDRLPHLLNMALRHKCPEAKQ